jgi:hypothetical protein
LAIRGQAAVQDAQRDYEAEKHEGDEEIARVFHLA